MARHPYADWKLNERCTSWEEVQVAVLMDIRDELQKLNNVLRCPNFMGIPWTLKRIASNTAKPRHKRKKIKLK